MLTKGGQRVDLDGNLAGEVTEEHIATAKERLAAKATKKAKPPGPKPQAAALNSLPADSPLTPENTVPGKLEVTIKFNELPKSVQLQAGYKFGLDCDGRPVVVILKPKHWNKLTQAAGEYQAWVAALSGKIGELQGKGFVLEQPSLQVFEKKPKVQEGAMAAAPQAASTPPPAAPAPAAEAKPAPASPSPAKAKAAAPKKPKLTLKR